MKETEHRPRLSHAAIVRANEAGRKAGQRAAADLSDVDRPESRARRIAEADRAAFNEARAAEEARQREAEEARARKAQEARAREAAVSASQREREAEFNRRKREARTPAPVGLMLDSDDDEAVPQFRPSDRLPDDFLGNLGEELEPWERQAQERRAGDVAGMRETVAARSKRGRRRINPPAHLLEEAQSMLDDGTSTPAVAEALRGVPGCSLRTLYRILNSPHDHRLTKPGLNTNPPSGPTSPLYHQLRGVADHHRSRLP